MLCVESSLPSPISPSSGAGLRAKVCAVSVATPSQGRRCPCSSAQARRAATASVALGPRTSAASSADSSASRPLACLPNITCAAVLTPTTSPRSGTMFRYASRICALLQRASSCWASLICPSFCNTLRPVLGRFRSASSKPASCMVTVDAPRVLVFHALAQALAAKACQSTPLCCQNCLSSLCTMALRRAGDICASPSQAARRTARSMRSVWMGSPLRSRSKMSDGLCSARTLAKSGNSKAVFAQAGVATMQASQAQQSQRAMPINAPPRSSWVSHQRSRARTWLRPLWVARQTAPRR